MIAGVALTVVSLVGCPAVPRSPVAIEGATPHVYRRASGTALRLWVVGPPRVPRPTTAVVFFFGGGWSSGSVAQFAPQAHALAALGYVAILADYRVRCRFRTGPAAAVSDARAAIAWVRRHATALGISHIVAAGGSAGGHLALSSAIGGARRFHPDALLLYNPVVDLTQPGVARYLPGQARTVLERLSPTYASKSGLPPFILFHGDADRTVPIDSTRAYCGAVAASGGTCALAVFAAADHGFFNEGRKTLGTPLYGPVLAQSIEFLQRHGLAPPE